MPQRLVEHRRGALCAFAPKPGESKIVINQNRDCCFNRTMETGMKPAHTLFLVPMLASLCVTAPAIVRAQVAGSTVLGVNVAELRDVAAGWSAKRSILGQSVYNDKNERVGSIDDIVVAPDKAISYAILNAGGFLGLTKHDVAVPVSQFKLVDQKLVLAGATKDALKATPPFEYAR
jgi:sporulation protein YlmC with PRC-barrel domain